MSQVLINQYLAELGRIKKASGSWRGLMVREAFKDLLKAWGRHHRAVPGVCQSVLRRHAGHRGPAHQRLRQHRRPVAGISDDNGPRIKRRYSRRISVVIGNPPYSAHQANENDNNKNREYPFLDDRIKKTYSAESTAQKTKLYDLYAHFFRWTSDRLHVDGVLAFVANRNFIDRRSFDGFRKTVAAEFAEIRLVDLGGEVRANPPVQRQQAQRVRHPDRRGDRLVRQECVQEGSRPQPRHPPARVGNGRGRAGLTGRREANRNR